MKKIFRVAISLTTIAVLMLGASLSYAQGPIEPPSVTAAIKPGDSYAVTKFVTLPEAPPMLDMVLIVDQTGSYFDDLPNIKAKAPEIFDAVRSSVPDSNFALATFVDFPFMDWGGDGEWAYKLNQDLTSDRTTWLNAVNAMYNLNGWDGPESQYEALYQAATGAGREMPPTTNGVFTDYGEIMPGMNPTFRALATRVIAITTDAPFHTPNDSTCFGSPGCPFDYPGPSRDATVNALIAAGIKVIAIKAPGSGGEMDDVATATGGSVTYTDSSSSDIANAILAALGALTYDVTAVPNGCDPLLVTFDPAMYADVAGGTTVEFQETITVPAGVSMADLPPDGVVNCSVDFYAGTSLIGSQELHITVIIPVPVDIKPGSCPNPFSLKDKGVVPVAILGTADFDVTKIDPATVRLNGIAPIKWAYFDVATPYPPFIGKPLDPYACHTLGADGFMDLTLKFSAPDLAGSLGSVVDRQVKILPLTGNLLPAYGSIPIVGEDVIIILKK